MSSKLRITKEQVHVISAVTFGNILEWFEIYSFAYLVPILSTVFSGESFPINNTLFVFIVFGTGFITRPIGGIIFGRMGDLLGRRKAFITSIVIMTLPTFLMGCLPTYKSLGIWAPVSLWLLRIIQSIPAGGELPGTICFLYENSSPSNRRFITSWNAVGNQIGAIVGLGETFLMDSLFSSQFMHTWGWRISFWSGGIIGLLGIYLRHTLHETPVFQKLKKSHKIDKETLSEVFSNFRKPIFIGTAYGVIDAATFYLLATYIPTVFDQSLGLSENQNILISFLILLISTILLPILGRIGDKVNNRSICIFCALLIIACLLPMHFAVANKNMLLLGILSLLFLFAITWITSLIAFLLSNLFPASVRFTGVGLTVNLSDGIVGGFTPAIAFIIFSLTGKPGSFTIYIFICSIVSLFSYYFYMNKRLIRPCNKTANRKF